MCSSNFFKINSCISPKVQKNCINQDIADGLTHTYKKKTPTHPHSQNYGYYTDTSIYSLACLEDSKAILGPRNLMNHVS